MLSRESSCRRSGGFALVLALALTGLAFACVLGFAAWIQFSLRAVSIEKAHAQARDLACVALEEAVFELSEHCSEDGCVLVDSGGGCLHVFPGSVEGPKNIGNAVRQWECQDGVSESCTYTLGVYRGGISEDLPVGGVLSSAVYGRLREPLNLESPKGRLAFGEDFSVYGPTWQVLRSYVRVCNRLKDGRSLLPQGHASTEGGSGIPLDTSTESFLETAPRWVIEGEQTERGDPVRFGVHPWLLSVDVDYALEVERSDIYYVPRVKESVRIRLYNPYDAPLAHACYDVVASGGLPEVTARVGLGNPMRVLLEDRWSFSSSMEAGEVREILLPERVVFEFPPVLENTNKLYVGLGSGALPSVKPSKGPEGTGRSLREAFFNKRQARAEQGGAKPAMTSKVQFYLDEGTEPHSLLQRIQGASFDLFDIAGAERKVVEKRVWEFPQLSGLAASGQQALFAWNYAANRMLPNPGAPLVAGAESGSEKALPRVALPRGVHSRMDLTPALRGVYGRDPLTLGDGPSGNCWEQALAPVLWDGCFYPLETDKYVACKQGARLRTPIDPQSALLRGACSINTIKAADWERFIQERAPTQDAGERARLAKALSDAIRERLPLRRMADFWGSEGVFQEALDRVGVADAGTLKHAICEHLVVRPDTFVVQGRGSIGREGNTVVEATCEAIVQRLPEAGRPYKIVAFRWVQKSSSL